MSALPPLFVRRLCRRFGPALTFWLLLLAIIAAECAVLYLAYPYGGAA